MLPLIAERRSEIAALCRRFGVRRLAVWARPHAARISIRGDPTLISWWRSSATTAPRSANFSRCVTAVGRPVDLVEEGSVRNPFIGAGIERSAETLYGSLPARLPLDARESANPVADFVRGRTLDDYLGDRMLRAAVERQFEIIGEALRQLEKTAPDLARELPELSQAIAFRNILIHGYATIDDRTVWRAVQESLPALRARLAELLDRIGNA